MKLPRLQAFLGAVSIAGVLGLTGCAAPVEEPSPDSTDEAPADTSEDITCDYLADEAVKLSKDQSEQNQGVTLLKVRHPEIKKDNRKTFELPKGDKSAVILQCRGAGVWSDGGNNDVRIKLTVDSDGEQFIGFQEILSSGSGPAKVLRF